MPIETQLEHEEGNLTTLKERLSKFETEEGRKKGLTFKPRTRDVFIVTTPKAGTTWMQNITHQLRMKGDEDFDEISAVVPWIELAADQGQDLDLEQKANPRLYKTHCWYEHCPKGARYIVVLRNPEDVAVSFYNFFNGWFFEANGISFDSFIREFILKRGRPTSEMQNASYWHHLISWYEHRNDDNVLLLFFEDLKENLAKAVAKVARFMGYKESDTDFNERVSIATHNSTFEFCLSHSSLFDEHLSKQARNEAMGLPREAGQNNIKIRSGQVGEKPKMLTEALREELRAKWEGVVEPATGCKDYWSLRERRHQEEAKGGGVGR